MYCKPSRNAEPKRKRQLGINLFPVLVSSALLALLAFVSFIFTNDLQRIKNLALSTSNSHLPQILAKQQMLLNVENMRRNIALGVQRVRPHDQPERGHHRPGADRGIGLRGDVGGLLQQNG